MKRELVLLAVLLLLCPESNLVAQEKLAALIVDGQNNHDWRATTPVLRHALEASGRYSVDVATSPPQGQDLSLWKPDFSQYDVVVLNYNGELWPQSTRRAFEDYVSAGGGVVVVHAANNAFPQWPEYNEMIGLGWRGSEFGDRLTMSEDGQLLRTPRNQGPGAGHGPQHEFQVVFRDMDHPITQGLPSAWMHARDELYHGQRGPGQNMTILATAFSAEAQGGTGTHEPIMWTIPYGQGRVFTTVLGHGDYSMKCVGFITTLLRGAQWAATGKVTIERPEDFPETFESHSRELPWLQLAGKSGAGEGKHIVLIAGDEEYRSEQALPMLARILAEHHGFRCTVLFASDPETDVINPDNQNHIPGLANLQDADLMILATRFRQLPDDQMRFIAQHIEAGKPVMGLRTATHAFRYDDDSQSAYRDYDFRSRSWPGGFGQQVLGDTWISHHGDHGSESTRGVINSEFSEHPILRGVRDIWGPTDVYGVKNLTRDADILVWGQVVEGMSADDRPLPGKKNDPMMPLAWTRPYTSPGGQQGTAFCTTMGASQDFESQGLRRLVVNACYWLLDMSDQIPEQSNVEIVGSYAPTAFGFGKAQRGKRASDYK